MKDAPEFRIDSISVLSFRQEEPSEPIQKGREHAVGARLISKLSDDGNKIRIKFVITLHDSDSPESAVLVELVTAMDFEFKEGQLPATRDEKGRAVFSDELIVPLVSMAYSTTRGILFTKLGNSQLSRLILPAAPIHELMQADLSPENDD